MSLIKDAAELLNSNVIKKIKEDHFILFPYLILTYFGNGLIFLLAENNFNISRVLELFPSIQFLIIYSAVISAGIYFIFILISKLFSNINKGLNFDLLEYSFTSTYFYFASIFMAILYKNGNNLSFNRSFMAIILLFIILFGTISCVILPIKYFLKKQKKTKNKKEKIKNAMEGN